MDHTNHTQLTAAELTDVELEGATIYDSLDEEVGMVSHMHGSHADGSVIVDVGTFLGMGGKSVALPMRSLNFMRDEDGEVHATTSFTRDEIEALPEHEDY